MQEIIVDMAEYAIGKAPEVLVVKGLGSCVAVCLYHKESRMGALCHVMLPQSYEGQVSGNPLRFMDKMLERVLFELQDKGILLPTLEAKLIGGAEMFPILNKELKDSVSMGGRNVQVAEEILKSNGIMTIAKEVGGNHGRSLKFHLDTGIVTVEKKI